MSDGVRLTTNGVVSTTAGVATTIPTETVQIIDSFEDGEIAEYTGDTGPFNVVAASNVSVYVPDGSYLLEEADTGFNSIRAYPGGDELPNYFPQGTEVELWSHVVSGDQPATSFEFGHESGSSSRYQITFDYPNDTVSLKDKGGSGFLANFTATLSTDTWYVWNIVWDDGSLGGSTNDITVTVDEYDVANDSRTQIGQCSVNDNSNNGEGIGFVANEHLTTCYFDYAHQVPQ